MCVCDFFHLFREVCASTFTKELILGSFEATGISLLQPNVIFQRFAKDTPEAFHVRKNSSSVHFGNGWLKMETLLREAAKDESSKEMRKIRRSLHHISIHNSILQHKIADLKSC